MPILSTKKCDLILCKMSIDGLIIPQEVHAGKKQNHKQK